MTDQPTEPAGAASHDLTLASSYDHYDQRMVTEAPHPVLGWARGWHLATFVMAVAGLLLQLWLSATHPLYPGRYSTPILLWNVLSYFTVWNAAPGGRRAAGSAAGGGAGLAGQLSSR
jgi:hypothetical protein